jgi:choline dehydrogenase-like flavoprotein
MADDPGRGMCDVQGACFGVEGLSICDASSLPSNTGVNPQITILANALRIAEGLVAAHA